MLSVAEVYNMGLARGYRPEPLYGRDAYGLETAALEAAGGNAVLQQQLNDLISNSLLQQNGLQQQSSSFSQGGGDSSCLVGASYPGLTSMGFSQSDIDRTNFLLDDLPPLVDHGHHENRPNGFVPVSSVQQVSVFALDNPLVTVGLGLQPQQHVQQHQPQQRPWLDEKLSSPRGLKRVGSLDRTALQPRKKLDKSARTVDTKTKRSPTEHAGDHILRERQRRDDMTSKFAVLESLLPAGVKRDRSTIVDDSIEYVKNLHHRINALRQRKLELNRSPSNQKWVCQRLGPIEVSQPRHGSPGELKEKESGFRRPRISEEELKGIHDVLRSCLEKMEVHADLPHQVVIEMVCKPQPRLQSNILLCMENLKLDVMQCSITRIAHRFICVIIAKPREKNTSGIVASLKHALQQ